MWHRWRLLLRQWFSGFTGPAPLVLRDRERLALFVALAAATFAGTWLLFYFLTPLYDVFATLLTQLVLTFSGRPIEVETEGSRMLFRSEARPRFEADFSWESIRGNAPLLWALLLATPGMRLSRRFRVWLLGAALLLATHACFAVVKIEIALVEAGHPLAGNETVWRFLDDFFEIGARGFFPMAIWIPLAFEYLRGRVDPRGTGRTEPPGRNEPCSCGSGRKFKHCCGRA